MKIKRQYAREWEGRGYAKLNAKKGLPKEGT